MIQQTIEYDKNFDDNTKLPFTIHPQIYLARGQVQFCHKLIVKLFEKGKSPCKQKFTEMRIKKQIFDHYIKGICNITSYYGIATIEILPPQPNQTIH